MLLAVTPATSCAGGGRSKPQAVSTTTTASTIFSEYDDPFDAIFDRIGKDLERTIADSLKPAPVTVSLTYDTSLRTLNLHVMAPPDSPPPARADVERAVWVVVQGIGMSLFAPREVRILEGHVPAFRLTLRDKTFVCPSSFLVKAGAEDVSVAQVIAACPLSA